MLQTKYDVKFSIDDKEYSVVFTPLSSSQVKELNDFKKSSLEKFKESDSLKKSLKTKKEIYNLNNEALLSISESLKVAEDADKLLLLKEQKDLISEQKSLVVYIDSLNKKIKEELDKTKSVEDDIKSFDEKQFDMCVSGPDIDKLKALIIKSNLTFNQVIAEIAKVAKEESEKK